MLDTAAWPSGKAGCPARIILALAEGGVAIAALALGCRRRKDARVWLAVVACLPAAVMLSGRLSERPDWYVHGFCLLPVRPGLPARILVHNLGQSVVCIAHLASGQ